MGVYVTGPYSAKVGVKVTFPYSVKVGVKVTYPYSVKESSSESHLSLFCQTKWKSMSPVLILFNKVIFKSPFRILPIKVEVKVNCPYSVKRSGCKGTYPFSVKQSGSQVIYLYPVKQSWTESHLSLFCRTKWESKSPILILSK